MKTRKILALVMAIALLAVSMSVVASAAGTYTILFNQNKSAFTDVECFDPTGLVIADANNTQIKYATEYQYFTFSVELDEPLTVYITEIEVFYKGDSCGFVPVVVSHAGGEITPVNNHSHGEICAGCGVVCKNAEHTVSYWVPNGDAGLLTSETETGTCLVCGDTVSRYIEGTATYPTVFASADILVTLLSIVSMIVEAFALI